MNKSQLSHALNSVEDSCILKGAFKIARYSSTYSCFVDGISLVYNQEHSWSAVIKLEAEPDEHPEEAHKITKGIFMQALSVIDDDAELSASFRFSEYGSTYDALIDGLEIQFSAEGFNVILKAIEVVEEEQPIVEKVEEETATDTSVKAKEEAAA